MEGIFSALSGAAKVKQAARVEPGREGPGTAVAAPGVAARNAPARLTTLRIQCPPPAPASATRPAPPADCLFSTYNHI